MDGGGTEGIQYGNMAMWEFDNEQPDAERGRVKCYTLLRYARSLGRV